MITFQEVGLASPRVKRTGGIARFERIQKLGVSYARYSEEIQGSITEQEGVNRETAEDAEVALVAYFSDPAVSRSIADRPGLLSMFEYLEQHPEVGFIVVNELERLTAGVAQRAKIASMCERLGITILTEDMGEIDPRDEDAMQAADLRAVQAKAEVLKVQRRTRRTMKQKVKEGGRVAMRPAFGIRMKPLIGPDGEPLPPGMRMVDERGRTVRSGEIEIEEKEIDWLRKIFELADLDYSDDAICRYLMAENVPTKSGMKLWRGNTVAGILTNPLYKGEMIWGNQAVRRREGKKFLEVRPEGDPGRVIKPSPLGALVDPDLWERVNSKREARLGELRQNRRTFPRQVFDGRVYCLACGYKMYGRMDNGGKRHQLAQHRTPLMLLWRYYCYAGRRNLDVKPGFGPPCQKGHNMPMKKLLATLSLSVESPNFQFRPVRTDQALLESTHKKLAARKKAAEGRYERAKDAYLGELISKKDLEKAKAQYDGELAAVSAELLQLEGLATDSTTLPVLGYVTAEDWRGLITLLTDETIPVEHRVRALDDAGVGRIFIHFPRVEVEVGRGKTSSDGSPLSGENADRTMKSA